MKKTNVAELLRNCNCPKGMELDCIMYEGVTLYGIDDSPKNKYPIQIKTKNGNFVLTKHGTYTDIEEAKCVIFPKGKTTWDGFQPFEDGDIVFYNDTIAIFKEWGDETLFRTYVTKYLCCDSLIDMNVPLFGKSVRREIRFATEEEKEKLFDAIKANGYIWNAETKTLEELIVPKFKVGDRIKSVISSSYYTVVDIKNDQYFIKQDTEKYPYQIPFSNEINYKLVPSKFDITTLKPLESWVLVRDYNDRMWMPAFWGKDIEDSNCRYLTSSGCYKQCIPLKDNEHLLGTTNDCDEFYKNWK